MSVDSIRLIQDKDQWWGSKDMGLVLSDFIERGKCLDQRKMCSIVFVPNLLLTPREKALKWYP
jgi:hypothetical protein